MNPEHLQRVPELLDQGWGTPAFKGRYPACFSRFSASSWLIHLIRLCEPTSCPIELSPIKAVVKHGDPGSVNCSTSDGTSKELGWEASQGGTRKSNATDLPWEVVSVTNWGMKPICYITNTDCQKTVDLVIYTFPESISFRSNESNDEMTEHKAHTFICDIFNIAPVQNLTVQWYKDDAVIHTAILNDETMEPTNLSPAFTFIPTRADRHVRFRCEARMDLGPEGPLFHASSAEYLTDVLCKYVIKHQLLFCYNTFFNSDTSINISDAFSSPSLATNVMEETEDGVSRLMIHDATGNNMGLYTCHAWNEHGYVSKTVTVTVQGRYLL
uniref:Ig-like domain-containing protein n=1 Tax=Nothobranchius furzeri TaxID=105023 RepID=A0A8C6NNJ5_NOTFU